MQAARMMRTPLFIHWFWRLCGVGLTALVLAPTTRAQGLEWRGFEEALSVADSTNRYVLVAVSAPWCGWCQKMKREVYPSASVQQCLARYYVVTRINPDAENRTYTYRNRRVTPGRLTALLGGDGKIPATIILSPSGDSLVQLSGYLVSQMLADVLAYVGTGAYRRASFRSYRTSAPAGCATRSRVQGDASATMRDSLSFPREGEAIRPSGG